MTNVDVNTLVGTNLIYAKPLGLSNKKKRFFRYTLEKIEQYRDIGSFRHTRHKTQDEEKKSKKHKTKKISNTDTTKTGGDPGVREDTRRVTHVYSQVQ
jgi:predicted nucleic acid-binding protein